MNYDSNSFGQYDWSLICWHTVKMLANSFTLAKLTTQSVVAELDYQNNKLSL